MIDPNNHVVKTSISKDKFVKYLLERIGYWRFSTEGGAVKDYLKLIVLDRMKKRPKGKFQADVSDSTIDMLY